MGRKRKFGKGTEVRKEIDKTKRYFESRPKRIMHTFDQKVTKKLFQESVHENFVLQDMCEKEPERLLKISGFGPIKVKEICSKVGVQLKISELNRIYRNIEKEKSA
jgi:dTDP-4-dehydrorhamnose reductase